MTGQFVRQGILGFPRYNYGNTYKIIVGEGRRKISIGRPSRRYGDNIKVIKSFRIP